MPIPGVVKKSLKWMVVLTILSGVVLAILRPELYATVSAFLTGDKGGRGEPPDLYTVARGTLNIGLIEEGRLSAVKNHMVMQDIGGRTTYYGSGKHKRKRIVKRNAKLTWIIPEGATVNEGDKLLEFEQGPIFKEITSAEASKKSAIEKAKQATENIKIQGDKNDSLVLKTNEALDAQKEAYEIFLLKTAKAKVEQLGKAITAAYGKVASAKDTLAKALKNEAEQVGGISSKITTGKSAVDHARDAVKDANKAVRIAYDKKKIYLRKQLKEEKLKFEENIQKAKDDVGRAKRTAASELKKRKNELDGAKKTIKSCEDSAANLKKQLDNCVVKSPIGGIILYVRNARVKIEVGSLIYGGQALLMIPDLSAFNVKISVGEEHRGKICPPVEANATFEAVPGLEIHGTLKELARLAKPRSPYDRSGPKVFDGVVELKNADARLVTGMTARINIVAESVKNVLLVPIEAVSNLDGNCVCYLWRIGKFEIRQVDCGKSTDDFVEIVSGLEAGDQVALSPPQVGSCEIVSPTVKSPPTTTSPMPAAESRGAK